MKIRNRWRIVPFIAIAAVAIAVHLAAFKQRDIVIAGTDLSHPINTWYITLTILILFWHGARGPDRKPMWHAIDALVTGSLIIQALKLITHMPRPPADHGPDNGFPSGHTTFAFLLAWLMMENLPALSPLWFAVAAAIGWSRVETNAHYPYQVVVGSLLGCAIGYLSTHLEGGLLFPRIFGKRLQKKAEEGSGASEDVDKSG